MDGITHAAVGALVMFMSLEADIQQMDNEDLVTVEFMAHIARNSMVAGMCLMEAGWKPAEPLAITVLKMRRNLDKTRVHENPEKDDIYSQLEEYKALKGFFPKGYPIFLNYLEINGYYIDRDKNRIDCPGKWGKDKSISTVGDWVRDFHKLL